MWSRRVLGAVPVLLAVSLLLLLSTLLVAPMPIRGKEERFELVREGNPLLIRDDFSKNPVDWRFLNASRWDAGAGYIVLTEPGSQRVGVIWLKKNNVTSPFTAEFRYRVGGGSGADGFVFMFYKDSSYEPGIGGYLGFLCRPVEKPCPRNEAPGYGLEFDSYFNSKAAYGMNDPSPDHIAFLKDDINNHLVYVNDTRVEDNQWHNVKLIVGEKDMIAFLDGGEILRWSGQINRTFGGIGFGSGIWGQDNQHIIDDFQIYGNAITVRGLQPSWRVDIVDGDRVLASQMTATNGTVTLLETTGLTMPLEGHFRIYDGTNNGTIYESPIFHDIWGGDELALRPTSSSTVTSTATTTTKATATATTASTITSTRIAQTVTVTSQVTEIIGLPAEVTYAAVGVTVIALIAAAVLVMRKK